MAVYPGQNGSRMTDVRFAGTSVTVHCCIAMLGVWHFRFLYLLIECYIWDNENAESMGESGTEIAQVVKSTLDRANERVVLERGSYYRK